MRTFPPFLRTCFFPLLTILLSGMLSCAGVTADAGREWVKPAYEERIREWRTRVGEEGWTEGRVDVLLDHFRGLFVYRADIQDHWDTPKEFMKNGFSGDCEDIATFMMGTLKLLGYPRRVHILVVKSLLEDHALLKVEVAPGRWKVYDVVPAHIAKIRDTALLKPVVEFDETSIKWYAPSKVPTRVARNVGAPREGEPGEASSRTEPDR